MAYTPFAFLAAVVILSVASSPTNVVHTDAPDVEQASAVYRSWEVTQANYALRSLQTLANISQDSTVTEVSEGLRNLTLTGSYEGVRRQNVSFKSWRDKTGRLPGDMAGAKISSLNISIENLSIKTGSQLILQFPKSNDTYEVRHEKTVSGVEDPLLAEIGYDSSIHKCSYNNLAVRAADGAFSEGTARGYPLVEPDDPAAELEPERKVMVVSNISEYDNSTTTDFAGYISEAEPGQPQNYNDNFVVGVSNLPDFQQGQTAIIFEGAWKGNFARTINSQCYLPSGLENTPSVEERIKKIAKGSTSQGAFTVLNASQLTTSTSESNIGYERIDMSGRELINIEGVSRGDGITWPYFRMSRELAVESGAQGLTE